MELNVTIVQPDIIWENISGNLQRIGEMIGKHVQKTNLILLPELFTTGFTMNTREYSELTNGHSMRWMKEKAMEKGANMAGSIIINDGGRFYNRLIWIKPEGGLFFYDKRHLFRIGGENLHFNNGREKLIVTLNDWQIRPLICYDLRFPVWSRNTADYDLLIYIANWPGSRRQAWETLLKARAIENQCYVIGVNRVGIDGSGITYTGDSMIVDFKGNIIQRLKKNVESIISTELNLQELRKFRNEFPVSLDADNFVIAL